MPTNKKWGVEYLGHYALNGAGGGPDDEELLIEIKDLPYFKGIQKRFTWKDMEGATPGSYNFTSLINFLDLCASYGKKLSILMMYKSFGGKAVPAYISKKPTDVGYDPAYTTDDWYGVYNWGSVTEIAAFFNPAVRDRFILFLQAMATAVDNHPALANIMMNETTMGSPSPALTTAQKTAIGLAMVKIMQDTIPAFVKTPVGWFVNFPNTTAYSVLDVLPPKLQEFGGILAGPDTWFHDTSLENGVVKDYFDSWNDGAPINPRAPSVQNPDYRHYSHAEQSASPPITRTDISIEKLFNRVTATVETFNTPNVTGGTKQPLHANYVNWSAWFSKIDGTERRPWVELKALLASYYAPGGRFAGSTTPGIDLTIPLMYETGTAPGTLPKLTASLTTDSGPSNSDKITNVGTVTSSALESGATRQFKKGDTGDWVNAQPAVTAGLNTYYVRQTKSGSTPSEPSDPLTFTFDDTKPVRIMATIDDNAVLLAYDSEIDLSNTSGFRPVHGDYTLAISGGGTPPSKTGMFVNETAKNVRIDLATNATAGVSYLLTYVKGAGTARLQDKAGNEADAFASIPLINITGMGSPTQTVTITGIPGVSASGEYTSSRNWTLSGTVSAALTEADQVQIERRIGAGSWESIGYATATGTSWSFVDNGNFADGAVAYRGKVRRGIGSKVGPTSAEFTINVLTAVPPVAPVVVGGTFLYGNDVVITGTWAPTAGHTLTVAFRGVTYTTDNGLNITGSTFMLTITGVPPGTYTVAARVTDLAGNFATDEDSTTVSVPEVLTKSRISLAFRRVVRHLTGAIEPAPPAPAPAPAPSIDPLFVGGQKGGIYKLSDFSKLFQDAAGTVPVTAVGQPVARINDSSPNGYHWIIQTPDDTERPLLNGSGGSYWLDFDGVNDGFSTGAITLTGGAWDFATRIRRADADQVVLFYDTVGGANFVGAAQDAAGLASANSGAPSTIVNGTTDTENGRTALHNALTVGNDHTVEVLGATLDAWASSIKFGSYFSTWPFNGRFYGAVIRQGTLTSSERELVRSWLLAQSTGGSAPTPPPPPAPEPPPPPPPPAPAPENFRVVGPSATGDGSGNDWNNQLAWGSFSPVRGFTYFVRGHAAAARMFNTALNSTQQVIIKKATASDHGTDTGWNTDWADDVLAITGTMDFRIGYFVLDGTEGGGPGSWMTGHGITITQTSATASCLTLENASNQVGFEFKRIRFIGMDNRNTAGGSMANDGIKNNNGSSFLVQRCHFKGIGRCPIWASVMRQSEHTVELSCIETYWGSELYHSELAAIYGFTGTANKVVTYRWNLILHIDGTGGVQWSNDGNHNAQLRFYRNVVHYRSGDPAWWAAGNGIVGGWTGGNGEDWYNVRVHNNTFHTTNQSYVYPVVEIYRTGNREARNNVYVNTGSGKIDYTHINAHDYNHAVNAPGGITGETNGTSSPTDPYDIAASGNFTIKAGVTIPVGQNLGSPYDVDMYGNVGYTKGAINAV